MINLLRDILLKIEEGRLSSEEGLDKMKDLPFADLEVCKFDTHRVLRNNFSETILCEGKSTEHVLKIIRELSARRLNVLATRVNQELGPAVLAEFGKQIPIDYNPLSRTITIIFREIAPLSGRLAIICAGTADISIAEEARLTASYFGIEASKFYDVGVAGLQRLTAVLKELRSVDCAIVVAGMEGALPSVVGGLISSPIIAVPTSVGYGANLKGFTALLGMLNSCAEGVTVVNIDNGFGAACAAVRILRGMKNEQI
jgi:NCAIR mutase (PurE)-related protein